MALHQFELVGGDPVLDFLNTIHDWTVAQPRDYLPGFAEALRFAVAAGLLSGVEAAGAGPGPGERPRIIALRGQLERIFRAVVTARVPPDEDLEALASEAARAAGAARLRGTRGAVSRRLDAAAAGAALLRGRIAEAAVALLTSPRLARVKACPACGWFFLDASKNGSRRWCSMRTCGGSAKARRYYRRTRRRSSGGSR